MISVNRSQNKRGAAMMMFILFFAFATSSMLFILGKGVFSDLSNYNRLADSKRAVLAAESLTEDVVMRLVFGTYNIDDDEILNIGGVNAYSSTTYDSPSDEYMVDTVAVQDSVIRKSQAIMALSGGSAFNYGLQAGNGGITLSNNGDIYGNVYSNGTVQGAGSAEVHGEIVSAGPTGLIADISATGTVYADTIDNVDVGGDAHYNTDLGGSTIAGAIFSPAPNQPTTTMPISTTTIQEWKDAVEDYGTEILASDPLCAGGTYELDITTTIGYLKVGCNLDIKATGPGITITLDGPVWVEGDLSFTSGPDIEIDPALGRRSVQFIVSSSTNLTTSSRVEIRNSTNFAGTGDSRSYIMILSENESSELGGGEIAIDVAQSANGDVLVYTNTGLVEIGNNIDLRSVTGHQINVANGSSITYETGLASMLFTSGPGGGYTLEDWQQVE